MSDNLHTVDWVGLTSVSQAQCHYRFLIMSSMEMRETGNRKAYAVRRWLQALDRLLKASSMVEKEFAIRWASAWSTAYLGRMERRLNRHCEQNAGGFERRRRNRFRS
jgi:hypothetical protein